MGGIRIIRNPALEREAAEAKAAEAAIFAKGKIRVDWSQTRGGIATFVSGRMEGPLHDSEEAALEYLAGLGVNPDRITVK
jgi:hypothetical protein